MANSVDTLPADILQNIALQVAVDTYPPTGAPCGILPLLLTNSTLFHTLCMESCPHLYADIFRATFDTCAVLRRFSFQITDSALANELVIRCQTLQRVRRRSLLPNYLRKDLWTVFWMIQESDGLNESRLRDVHLSDYLLDILKYWQDEGDDPTQELRSLVICLLGLTLTQQHTCSLMSDVKATLQTCSLPFFRNVHGHAPSAIISSVLLSPVPSRDQTDGTTGTQGVPTQFAHNRYIIQHRRHDMHGMEPIVRYGREWAPNCPDPTPAAINLLFCLKEIDPIMIPQHFPENRSIALAIQRLGPTKEDLRKIRGYRTKLFADTLPSDYRLPGFAPGHDSRSKGQDLEFQKAVLGHEGVTEVDAFSMMQGLMTGVWEGFYMLPGATVPIPGATGHERQHHATPDFICRKPLQSVFAEYVCFADSNPNCPVADDALGVRNLPKLCMETDAGFELDGRKYERFTVKSDPRRQNSREKEGREPVDIVLLGETLEDHQEAWGGFRFSGRIRKDGSIILKREAKEDGGDTFSGTWIFEGRVRFGTVFVGSCSPSSSTTNNLSAVRGIFSMQKRAKDFTSW